MVKKFFISLLLLFSLYTHANTAKEANCLAENIYFEGRNQGTGGWIAITNVTLNRVQSDRFPNTICKVVFQGPMYKGTNIPVKHKCQFSWWCDGLPENINNMNLYMEIFYFANVMLTSNRLSFDITDGATHYHHYKVHPQWANKLTKVIRIGDQIFYRNK